jgi:hypothetical protein
MGSLYLGVYGEINHGAHRKPADLIGAPAFIWHQAFWNPVSGDRASREERAEKINQYLGVLHAKISSIDKDVSPTVEDIQVAYDDRVRASTLQFVWLGVRAKIRIENHTEYISLTSIIDASVDLSAVLEKRRDELPAQPTLYAGIKDKIENFRDGTHRPFGSDDLPDFPTLNGTHKFVFYDIWNEWFFPELLDAGDYLSTFDNGSLRIGGLRFADLRGFVTCEEYPVEKEKREAEDRVKASEGSGSFLLDNRIQGPFYKIEEERRGQWQRNWIPSEAWARRRLDNAWPFLSLAGDGPSPMPGRTEFTVGRLLGGRVLYASALGPQPRLGATTPGLERPVLFYLHSITQCERQIGRLVDRLCQLGTLRLAALIPLPALKSVPEQLTKIEEIITTTRNQTHKLIQEAMPGLERPSQLETEILRNLEAIQNCMNSLSAGKSAPASAKIGEAALEYRLQRSAYYKAIFFSLIPAMRIKRLEGYQPYNEFIEHRLQSAFGFIESLEARIRAVRTDWRALDQLYLSAAITMLTAKIDREQNNAQKAQKKIMWIQLVGEALLTVFLIPYYSLALLMHVLGCEGAEWCVAKHVVWEEAHLNVEMIIAGVVWIAFVAIGFRRYRRDRKKMIAENLMTDVGDKL